MRLNALIYVISIFSVDESNTNKKKILKNKKIIPHFSDRINEKFYNKYI